MTGCLSAAGFKAGNVQGAGPPLQPPTPTPPQQCAPGHCPEPVQQGLQEPEQRQACAAGQGMSLPAYKYYSVAAGHRSSSLLIFFM